MTAQQFVRSPARHEVRPWWDGADVRRRRTGGPTRDGCAPRSRPGERQSAAAGPEGRRTTARERPGAAGAVRAPRELQQRPGGRTGPVGTVVRPRERGVPRPRASGGETRRRSWSSPRKCRSRSAAAGCRRPCSDGPMEALVGRAAFRCGGRSAPSPEAGADRPRRASRALPGPSGLDAFERAVARSIPARQSIRRAGQPTRRGVGEARGHAGDGLSSTP